LAIKLGIHACTLIFENLFMNLDRKRMSSHMLKNALWPHIKQQSILHISDVYEVLSLQVVHPAPGHSEGTLVNALLYHCGLPAMKYAGSATATALETPLDESEDIADEDADEDVAGGFLTTWSGPAPVIRPGIVHRLDKGTSGLLVVAKVLSL
jgi:hypothetical protein